MPLTQLLVTFFRTDLTSQTYALPFTFLSFIQIASFRRAVYVYTELDRTSAWPFEHNYRVATDLAYFLR